MRKFWRRAGLWLLAVWLLSGLYGALPVEADLARAVTGFIGAIVMVLVPLVWLVSRWAARSPDSPHREGPQHSPQYPHLNNGR